jgi:hypothetical protein
MGLLGRTAEGAGFGDAEVAKLVEFHKEEPAVDRAKEAGDTGSPASSYRHSLSIVSELYIGSIGGRGGSLARFHACWVLGRD